MYKEVTCNALSNVHFYSVTAIITLKILIANLLPSRGRCLKFKLNFKFGMQSCFGLWGVQ